MGGNSGQAHSYPQTREEASVEKTASDGSPLFKPSRSPPCVAVMLAEVLPANHLSLVKIAALFESAPTLISGEQRP